MAEIFFDEEGNFRPLWVPLMVMALILDWMMGPSDAGVDFKALSAIERKDENGNA